MTKYTRLMALVALVVAAQFALYNLHLKQKAIRDSDILGQLTGAIETQPDIISLGDSVLTSVEQEGAASLEDLVLGELDGCDTAAVSHAAFQSRVYRAYTEAIIARSQPPPALLIPINLRSFSPGWIDNPSWQFDSLMIVGSEGQNPFFHFMRALNANNPEPQLLLDGMPLAQSIEVVHLPIAADAAIEGLSPHDIKVLGQVFTDSYLVVVTPDNVRLRDLVRLAELSQQEDITLQLYYPPIDIEYGERIYGEPFRVHVQQNIDTINAQLRPYDVVPLDMAFDLPHDDFSYRIPDVNEHMATAGRAYVSGRLLDALQGKLGCLE